MTSSTDGRRLRGDRGMATVTGLVLLFAFTSAGVIWLARDVNRTVSNRSTAQSIAFQAARAGAQQLAAGGLREAPYFAVEAAAAESAAISAAAALLTDYALDGEVTSVSIDGVVVEVAVRIDDPAGVVTGVASARAERVP